MTSRRLMLFIALVLAVAGCGSPVVGRAVGPSTETGTSATAIIGDNTRIFCTLAVKTLDYLDTVKAAFDRHDGTTSVNFLEDNLSEAAATMQTVYFSYLGTQIDLDVFTSFHSFRTLADPAVAETRNSDLPHRLRSYAAVAEDFRNECSLFL